MLHAQNMNTRKRHKSINMQKLWRRDYNFNVNKDQLPLSRFYKNLLWNGDFLSFKSTTHDIMEFNPVLASPSSIQIANAKYYERVHFKRGPGWGLTG